MKSSDHPLPCATPENLRAPSVRPLSALMLAAIPAALPLALSAAADISHSALDAPHPPNILFILIDDLGWGDVGPNGQKFIDTPNFDRFAAQGMNFTNGYSPSPICSASRAASLTGRSPARLHFEFVTKPGPGKPSASQPLRQPAYPRDLPLSEISLAEALAPAGYKTGYYGKWHLTQETNGRYLGHGDKFGPPQQGFAETSEERGSHPYAYEKDLKKNGPLKTLLPLKKGEYPPDALVDQANDFLQRHKNDRFFLFLSHYYVHVPLDTRCEWLLEKYTEKSKKLGLNLSKEKIIYAAFVETMDHLVGRTLEQLDKLGLASKTLVVLTSDNGGDPRYAWNGLCGSKWTLYEGGVREPFIVRWPGHIKPAVTCDVPVIATDLMPTFCAAAGINAPDVPLDGLNLLPLLTGQSKTLPRDTLTWHFPFYHKEHVDTRPCSSIRKGDMKLIYFYEDERSELYNLATDPQEKTDLSQAAPDQTRALKDELIKSLKAQNARFPTKNTPKNNKSQNTT